MFKTICPLGDSCPYFVCIETDCYFYRLVAESLDYLEREIEKEKTAD